MKKRILSFLLATLLCLQLLPGAALAAESEGSSLTGGSVFYHESSRLWYGVIGMDTVNVYHVRVLPPQDSSIYSGAYNIPASFTYAGAKCIVEQISTEAFQDSGITHIHIEREPKLLSYYISDSAFANCSDLTQVTFGSGFRNRQKNDQIGPMVFSGCTVLKQVTIPASVGYIGAYAFRNCTALETVVYEYPYSDDREVQEKAFEGSSPTITNQYATPENPRWEGTVATWDALDTSYVRYLVQFSGTSASGLDWRTESFYTTANSMNLSAYSSEAGTFSFTVKAVEPEIVFNNLKVYDSTATQNLKLTVGGAELTDVQAVRTGPWTAALTFHSNTDGSLYYLATQLESIDGPSTDGAGIPCTQGSNTVTLTGLSDEALYLELRLKNSYGMQSDLVRLALPNASEFSIQVGSVALYPGEYTTNGITKSAAEPTGTGYAYYKDGVLTLNAFTYSGGGANDAAIYTAKSLKIQLLGASEIHSAENNGILVEGDLELYGGGALSVPAKEGTGMNVRAIWAYGNLSAKNVTLDIQNEGNGISSIGSLTLDSVTADIRTKTGCCLSGSPLNITGSTLGLVSDEHTCVFSAYGDIEIANSTLTAAGNVALGMNPGYTLQLGSGTYRLSGTHDYGAIYVYNSTLTLPAEPYWWKTEPDGNWTANSFVHNKQAYIEITTTAPPAAGSITNIQDIGKIYDGHCVPDPRFDTPSTGEVTFAYKQKGADDSTYTATAPANVGEYTVRITVAADASYTEATATKDFAITKAALEIEAKDKTITYGEKPEDAYDHEDYYQEVHWNGLDTSYNEGNYQNISFDFAYKQFDDVGKYDITPKGFDPAPNYEVTYKSGTLFVEPLEAQIEWIPLTAEDLVFDGQPKVLTARVKNAVNGDDVSVMIELHGDNENVTEAGFYYTVVGLTGTKAGNYTLGDGPGSSPVYQITTAAPTVAVKPAASGIKQGNALEASGLTGGSFTGASGETITGTYRWKDGSQVMDTPGKLQATVVFTPDDTFTNYKAVEFEVEVNVRAPATNPETGDSGNLLLWSTLMLACALVLGATPLLRKQRGY